MNAFRGCIVLTVILSLALPDAPAGDRGLVNTWIETGKRDLKDGQVGIVGYEINFNRYFYRDKPLRPLAEIESDIRAIEGDIVQMLAEVTGDGIDRQ